MKKYLILTFCLGLIFNLNSQNSGCFYSLTSNLFTITPNSVSHAIVRGDFNNDGHTDLAISANNNINILLGNSTGNFTYGNNIFLLNTGGLDNLTALNFNNDSNLDLAYAFNGVLYLLNGDGTGNFSQSVLSNVGCQLPGSIYADFLNPDNNIDIIVGSKCNPSFYSYYGNGNNALISTAVTNTPTGGPSVNSILSHDINLDGQKEIIAVYRNLGSIGVYNGSSTNNYSAPTFYTVGAGPTELRKADLNNDGIVDFVTFNSINEGYSVLLGTSNFTLSPAQTNSLSPEAKNIELADFNLDGNIDLAVSYTSSVGGTIMIYNGLGNGSFGPASTTLSVGNDPASFLAVDVNNDLKTDIVCANKNSSTLQVWLNGNLLIGAVPSYTACSGTSITLNASGAQSYTWSYGANGASPSYPVSTNTLLTVIGSNSLSTCTSSASVNISALISPTLTVSASASMICAGETVTLNATGADAYLWNNAATTSVVIVQLNNSATFTVNGINSNNCQASKSLSVQVNVCTGLQEVTENKYRLFPVPAQDQIEISGENISQIEILNINGELLESRPVLDNKIILNIKHFPEGVYLARITSKTGQKKHSTFIINRN